jgi:rhodanese-related sulfurtransferase
MSEAAAHYQRKLDFETDSWDLQQALRSGENVVVIDARSRTAYDAQHIPGAICLPHREMSEEKTRSFDRDALYVTYCDGIGCNASTKGALRMTQLGFHAKELIGGIDWWKRDGHPTEKPVVELQSN